MKTLITKKNNIKSKDSGFTLVEALISITILMISVAAPLNLAGQGLVAADIAQRQIVAFYLAQDATETIINIKTANKLNNGGIMDNLIKCKIISGSGNGCYIDTINLNMSDVDNSIYTCSTADCSNGELNFNPTGGVYWHAVSGNPAGFTRFVRITPVTVVGGIDEEIEILTTVWWNAANGTRQTHTLTTNVSNW